VTVGIVASILVFEFGALLLWRVDRTIAGIDVDFVALILMMMGSIGFLSSVLLWWMSWRRGAAVDRNRAVVDPDDPYAAGRRRR
jgi:hypothetical protein